MKTENNITLLRTFFASLRNITHLCYSSVNYVFTEKFHLPLAVLNKIETARTCTIHLNRMLQVFDHILTHENLSESLQADSFDSEQLFEAFARAFEKTVSSYSRVSVNFSSKLTHPLSVLVNKDILELIFLNIFYSGMRNADSERKRTPKFDLYVTETKSGIVFHIRDNCKNIDPDIVRSVFEQTPLLSREQLPTDSLIALSLEVANLSVKEISGSLNYKALKSGNRYDITLPKHSDITVRKAKSPKTYMPTYFYIRSLFADLDPNTPEDIDMEAFTL